MLDIAWTAPADQIERYLFAADTFRMPYWDWAQGDKLGPVPDAFLTRKINVMDTDGTETSIRNPLYSYKFHEVPSKGFDGKVSNPTHRALIKS